MVRRKDLVIAYLEQHVDGDDRTPEQTVLAARPDIAALDAEMRTVEAELAGLEVVADLARMDRCSRTSRICWIGGSPRRGRPRRRGTRDARLARPRRR